MCILCSLCVVAVFSMLCASVFVGSYGMMVWAKISLSFGIVLLCVAGWLLGDALCCAVILCVVFWVTVLLFVRS